MSREETWMYETHKFRTEHFIVKCVYTGPPADSYRSDDLVIDLEPYDIMLPLNLNILCSEEKEKSGAYITLKNDILLIKNIDVFCDVLKGIPDELRQIKTEVERRFPGVEVHV